MNGRKIERKLEQQNGKFRSFKYQDSVATDNARQQQNRNTQKTNDKEIQNPLHTTRFPNLNQLTSNEKSLNGKVKLNTKSWYYCNSEQLLFSSTHFPSLVICFYIFYFHFTENIKEKNPKENK